MSLVRIHHLQGIATHEDTGDPILFSAGEKVSADMTRQEWMGLREGDLQLQKTGARADPNKSILSFSQQFISGSA